MLLKSFPKSLKETEGGWGFTGVDNQNASAGQHKDPPVGYNIQLKVEHSLRNIMSVPMILLELRTRGARVALDSIEQKNG